MLSSQLLYEIFLFNNMNIYPTKEDLLNENINTKFLDKLAKNNYIQFNAYGQIYITDLGRQYVQDCLEEPEYRPNTTQWTLEARTGLKNSGKQSNIANAAIPNYKRYRRASDNSTDLDVKELISFLSARFNKSETIILQYYADDKILYCSKCKKMGLFRNSKTRPNGLQPYCIKCQDTQYINWKRKN